MPNAQNVDKANITKRMPGEGEGDWPDFVLQALALRQMLLCSEPHTIVLVTGDNNGHGQMRFDDVLEAAVRRNAELNRMRELMGGGIDDSAPRWRVEVWSWSASVSRSWFSHQARHPSTLSIHLLDEFRDFLVVKKRSGGNSVARSGSGGTSSSGSGGSTTTSRMRRRRRRIMRTRMSSSDDGICTSSGSDSGSDSISTPTRSPSAYVCGCGKRVTGTRSGPHAKLHKDGRWHREWAAAVAR